MASRSGSRSKNAISEASLLEQVRLLKIENETLRSFIADKGFGEPLQPTSANLDGKTTEKKPRQRSISAVQSKKSPNVPTTPRTPFTASGKGCSCKGNCSTKVCGCVKKNIPCSEFCRCGDELCQNSDIDKENVGDVNQAKLSKDDEESLNKLSNLTLGDDKKGPKKKLAELLPENKVVGKVIKPRSIFSPDAADDEVTYEDVDDAVEPENSAETTGKEKESHKEPAKKSRKNEKKTDNSKAKNSVAVAKQANTQHPALSDNKMEDDSEPKTSYKSKKTIGNRGRANTKQSNLTDLEPMDTATQGDKDFESELPTKGKKKVEIKNKSEAPTGKQKNRIDPNIEDSEENEHSEPEPAKKMNKKGKKKTTGRVKKNKRINSEENDDEDFGENEPSVPKTSKPKNRKKDKEAHEEAEEEERSDSDSEPKKRPNRRINSQDTDKTSQDSENSEYESDRPNETKNIGKKAAAGDVRKENSHVESGTDDDADDHSDSEYKPPKKNKKVAKKAMATDSVKKVNDGMNSEDENEIKHQDMENSDSDNEPAKKNKKRARRIKQIHSEDQDDNFAEIKNARSNSEPENEDHGENDGKKETLDSPTGSNASSSNSYGTNTSLMPESDDFNPMKPRRQLSRSPLASRVEQRPQKIDVSNVPLPIPVKEEPEEEITPPAELAKDIVDDWDKHQAMLVQCRKCQRKFHEHRLKKHEASCKNI